MPHFCISESPRYVGRAVAALAADPDVRRWSGQSLSSGQLAQVYGFTDTDGTRPDCWRYLVEVREAGLPAATPATGDARGPRQRRDVRLDQDRALAGGVRLLAVADDVHARAPPRARSPAAG